MLALGDRGTRLAKGVAPDNEAEGNRYRFGRHNRVEYRVHLVAASNTTPSACLSMPVGPFLRVTKRARRSQWSLGRHAKRLKDVTGQLDAIATPPVIR